uniref:LIM domain transcription factor LMO4 n=1 Tax=Equus asinus TaxID=9793 RepID=A0A9L0IGP2_EQUAS
MAVTTMACERCCLKYEKPVSQLYTPQRLPPPSPRLPSHHQALHLPSASSSLLPFQKTELFPTCELQLHFPRQSSGGNVAAAGAASPLPSARTRGLAGAGEGPGAATMVNPGSSSQPPPVTAGSLSWKRCAGCGGKIADRFLLYAMDSYWHSRCLKCSCCQAQLGDIGTSCYTKSGMILCRNDYIRLFGNSGACSACGQSIPASELVMRAQGNVYHLKCFTCSTCRNRLVPGDRFHYINGSLFCEHDRPTALINGHLNSLQSNPLLPDQKVC